RPRATQLFRKSDRLYDQTTVATRPLSRRAGDDDSPHAETPAFARLRTRPAHQAHFGRLAADRRGIALSSSPASSQAGVGQSRMGYIFYQPPRSDLQAYAGGREASAT